MIDSALQALQEIESLFFIEWSDEQFEECLKGLGGLLSESAQNVEVRDTLAQDNQVWDQLKNILENLKGSKIVNDGYYRLLRGIYLLIRNLGVANSSIDLNLLYSSILEVPGDEHVAENLVLAWIQACSNCSQGYIITTNDLLDLSKTIKSPRVCEVLWKSEPARKPAVSIVNKALENITISEILSDTRLSALILVVALDVTEMTDPSGQLDHQLLDIFECIICHESTNNWIASQKEELENMLILVRAGQKITTSREDWNQFQLTAMLAWIYDLFVDFTDQSIAELTSERHEEKRLEALHSIDIRLLDTISHLCMFDTVRQFLDHYGAMQVFIRLLGTVHKNVQRTTIKEPQAPNSKKFPEVKSALIEVIAQLVHENFEMQEQVRLLHGLEIILSCCIIDDSNPFIKERSIICIKQLLAGNPENQNFSRSLEARKVVDEKVLEEVGYEIKIDDGNVTYAKK